MCRALRASSGGSRPSSYRSCSSRCPSGSPCRCRRHKPEAFLATAAVRAIVVAAALGTDQALLFGLAADEAVAAVQLRAARVSNADYHRVADGPWSPTPVGRQKPSKQDSQSPQLTGSGRSRSSTRTHQSILPSQQISLAAIMVVAAFDVEALVVTNAALAILVIAALGIAPPPQQCQSGGQWPSWQHWAQTCSSSCRRGSRRGSPQQEPFRFASAVLTMSISHQSPVRPQQPSSSCAQKSPWQHISRSLHG